MDRPTQTDRERLKEVHKTDLTESRVNEDFLAWLKSSGPSWLLAVMVVFTAYFAWVRWKDSRTAQRTDAWVQLADAQNTMLPSSFESVAEQFPKVDSVAPLARLQAGQSLLRAVQLGRALAPNFGEEVPPELTPQEREQYLTRADRGFEAVAEADDGGSRMTLLAVNALNGRAAVAEARGEFEQARRFYIQAADRAQRQYPALAEQARSRAETVDTVGPVAFASADRPNEIGGLPVLEDIRPLSLEPALQDLLTPR
jgi:hypothetical protein